MTTTYTPARSLAEALDYRAGLLRDLWAMRRGRNRQGVADRREELRHVRRRIAELRAVVAAG